MRGAHLAAMRDHGLVLETPKGRLAVDTARFVEHPSEAGSCDMVLFAVKAYDIESAAAPLKLLVDGGACVGSVLNGVDHQDRIASVLGAGSVLGGLARAEGVELPADIVARTLALHQSFPKTMYASRYHDLAKGRPLELDSSSGHIVRRGRALGIATPVHEMAWLALKPYLHGTPAPIA